MSTTKNAIIRIRTIDRCLKSNEKNYFLKDLIEECSIAVHEFKRRTDPDAEYNLISKRTIQYDLQSMKEEYPGFEAPIEHDNDEGYYYSQAGFEIFKASLSKSDLDRLGSALDILRQLSAENQFKDLASLVSRLDSTYKLKRKLKEDIIIQFDQGNNIEGQKWVDQFKQKIEQKETISMVYQPFGKEISNRIISPYQIREYNNRWFCIGYDNNYNNITNIGLDRVKSIKESLKKYYRDPSYNPLTYLKDVVGVSKIQDAKKIKIKFKAWGLQKYYLESKKLHHSQELLKETKDYALFQLEVIPNFELKSKILANLSTIEIVSPKSFKDDIIKVISKGLELYS